MMVALVILIWSRVGLSGLREISAPSENSLNELNNLLNYWDLIVLILQNVKRGIKKLIFVNILRIVPSSLSDWKTLAT